MAGCRITRPGTLKRLSERVGKPVVLALTRGNTGGRIDVGCADGSVYALWRDGAVVLMPDRYDPVRRAIVIQLFSSEEHGC